MFIQQNELIKRNELIISNCINIIQIEEKQKLLLIASKHLDILQESVEHLTNITNGKSDVQIKYLKDKIIETEQNINDNIDIIISIKSDLIEEE